MTTEITLRNRVIVSQVCHIVMGGVGGVFNSLGRFHSFFSRQNPVNNSEPNQVCVPTPPAHPGASRTILLLEDSPGEAELFCKALLFAWKKVGPELGAQRPDIEVHYTAKDALEFLVNRSELQAKNLPDLVVLDLDLPCGTGLTFLRQLRKDSRLITLPVIVMAWSREQPSFRSIEGLRIVGSVVKPMLFDELVVHVGSFCRYLLSGHACQEFLTIDLKGST